VQQPPAKDAPPPGEDPVSSSDVSQSPEEILAYWTPERMAEATPREILLPSPGEEPDREPEDN
jgi:hypothetical protein